jgi:hypothetical protein
MIYLYSKYIYANNQAYVKPLFILITFTRIGLIVSKLNYNY